MIPIEYVRNVEKTEFEYHILCEIPIGDQVW